MNGSPNSSELKTALEAFETSLDTPIVSGELADWIESVQQSWTEVSAMVEDLVRQVHPRQYEEISDADAALLPRVDQLRAEDEAIDRQRTKLNDTIRRSAQHMPKLEPDEEKGRKYTQQLIDEGIAFVTRVRKQEVAIETWYSEAFNRDRGAVD